MKVSILTQALTRCLLKNGPHGPWTPILFQQLTELLAGNGSNHWRSAPTSTWSEAHGHLSS